MTKPGFLSMKKIFISGVFLAHLIMYRSHINNSGRGPILYESLVGQSAVHSHTWTCVGAIGRGGQMSRSATSVLTASNPWIAATARLAPSCSGAGLLGFGGHSEAHTKRDPRPQAARWGLDARGQRTTKLDIVSSNWELAVSLATSAGACWW